jgi:hypothetical protein
MSEGDLHHLPPRSPGRVLLAGSHRTVAALFAVLPALPPPHLCMPQPRDPPARRKTAAISRPARPPSSHPAATAPCMPPLSRSARPPTSRDRRDPPARPPAVRSARPPTANPARDRSATAAPAHSVAQSSPRQPLVLATSPLSPDSPPRSASRCGFRRNPIPPRATRCQLPAARARGHRRRRHEPLQELVYFSVYVFLCAF